MDLDIEKRTNEARIANGLNAEGSARLWQLDHGPTREPLVACRPGGGQAADGVMEQVGCPPTSA
ncbi:hypothetical protein [Paraburkholderia graminis]